MLQAEIVSVTPVAETIPCAKQDGDGEQWQGEKRGVIGVVPVVDGVAQPSKCKEDAENCGERPGTPPRPSCFAQGTEAGAGGRRDAPGTEYLFAIEHGSLRITAAAASIPFAPGGLVRRTHHVKGNADAQGGGRRLSSVRCPGTGQRRLREGRCHENAGGIRRTNSNTPFGGQGKGIFP